MKKFFLLLSLVSLSGVIPAQAVRTGRPDVPVVLTPPTPISPV